jgi:predicted anti-sigma-YlaC factor YlaD
MKHFCKEASQLASDAFERDLTFAERFRLRLHLTICSMCRNYAANLTLLNRIFSAMRHHADKRKVCLPDQKREDIRKAIRKTTSVKR